MSPKTWATTDACVWSRRVKISTTTFATNHRHGRTAPSHEDDDEQGSRYFTQYSTRLRLVFQDSPSFGSALRGRQMAFDRDVVSSSMTSGRSWGVTPSTLGGPSRPGERAIVHLQVGFTRNNLLVQFFTTVFFVEPSF